MKMEDRRRDRLDSKLKIIEDLNPYYLSLSDINFIKFITKWDTLSSEAKEYLLDILWCLVVSWY